MGNFVEILENFYEQNILTYIRTFQMYPVKLISVILDLIIVVFLIYQLIKIVKDSRAWQLIKGITFLIIARWLSDILNLTILNYLLSEVMNWGVILLIIIFQPEIRRALEQLGTNKFTKFFGIDNKDIVTRTKEDIYKIVIAVSELSKASTGALIVIERDIKIKDIVSTGIVVESEISPQLLVNIFVPNTPLHDGAVVISNNKIAAAACMLPLASDMDIAKELGTRHRAAIGISKESDGIAIVVSEETGKISVAKDGTLIADVKEEALKKILINNVITKRFPDAKQNTTNGFQRIKSKIIAKNQKENKVSQKEKQVKQKENKTSKKESKKKVEE
ncbi:MAG: TIGR00159 family protein [Clostridia bacterium]|nr:TIGR00159 family protein [Clostridia bacterium]